MSSTLAGKLDRNTRVQVSPTAFGMGQKAQSSTSSSGFSAQ